MKALSIRQPWAWAILHAGKRVENRDWRGCTYRGPILLHAATSVGTRNDFHSAIMGIVDVCGLGRDYKSLAVMRAGEERWSPHVDLSRGGIVGRARIVDVVRQQTDLCRIGDGECRTGHPQRAWWTGGFALVLADVEPLPFVACKGALGLFDVPGSW